MARYGNTSIRDSIRNAYRNGGMVIKLIFINVAVFVLFNLLYGIILLLDVPSLVQTQTIGNNVINYFTPEFWLIAPAKPSELLYKPWTIISYQFMHAGLSHIFWNMLIFFFMGRIFNQYFGDRKVLTTYLMGGVVGFIFFILGYNLLPAFSGYNQYYLIGASASVMAVVVGIATYMPNYTVNLFIFGAVQIKWIALVFVLLDLVGLSAVGNFGTSAAHLGGAFWGWFVFSQMRKGKDWNAPFERFFFAIPSLFKSKPKMRVAYKQSSAQGGPSRAQRTAPKAAPRKAEKSSGSDHQQRVDAILDKINKSGYESLSKAEKEFLFKASNRE